ncbi:hypothetical protein F4776DRAFT_608349 [Hypoxylon sp. NC0597]|nr:hypothetical protein F4776DRAFT_608349 [Hypoxylon sp. NC0597]
MDGLSTHSPTVMATSTQVTTAQQAPSVVDDACGILQLPRELIAAILSFLGDADAVSFSLTCKAAFKIFPSVPFSKDRLQRLSRVVIERDNGRGLWVELNPSRREFLRALTYDYPRLFLCRRCWTLHESLTGECRPAQHIAATIRDHCRRRPRGLMTFGPLWPNYAFTFDEARRVVERVYHGPRFGLPLSHLNISTDWKLAKLGAACSNPQFFHGYVKLDTEAVVIDGALFFHNIQRILLLPEKVLPLFRTSAASEAFTFCCHMNDFLNAFKPPIDAPTLRFFGRSVNSAISSIINMAQDGVGLPEPAGLDGWDLDTLNLHMGSLAGCTECTTDYAITVHNHGRAGVEIVSDAFQDLGGCAPPDRKWEHCWHSCLPVRYNYVIQRRRDHFLVNPEIFPTRPGTSAIKHPSAPTVQDLWESHEYERATRNRFHERGVIEH